MPKQPSQTLTPWLNGRLKRLTNMLNLEKTLDHASLWPGCYKYLFPTQPSSSYCSQSFVFKPISPARFAQKELLVGNYKVENHLGITGGKKNQLLNVGFGHLIMVGNFPGFAMDASKEPVQILLQIHSPWKKENIT